jgi:FkbM family methyltransferase
MSALRWALRHPLNHNRQITTVARWAVHNTRRRIVPGHDVTVTFADRPLRGPIDHPIINLITYVRGGLYDYDAMMSLGILLKPGQLFIDVGANLGSYSVLAGHLVGASGRIISVEPSPDQLSYLRYNLRDVPAETMICTDPLADQATRAQLAAPGLTTQHLVLSGSSDVEIMTSSLDAELARLGCRDGGGFAKIDVEGWEPAVIKGARGWLASRPVGLLVEANGLNHRSPVSWAESVEVLHGHGYEYTWPEFSNRVLHLFSKPQPKSPFEDYLILTPEARAHLQRSASLHIQAI